MPHAMSHVTELELDCWEQLITAAWRLLDSPFSSICNINRVIYPPGISFRLSVYATIPSDDYKRNTVESSVSHTLLVSELRNCKPENLVKLVGDAMDSALAELRSKAIVELAARLPLPSAQKESASC